MASSSIFGTRRTRASVRARVVLPDPEHPTTETRSISALLFGRPDQDLVDGDAAGLGHGVADALRDVLRMHDLNATEGLRHALQDLGPVVEGELSSSGAGFDERDPHVAGGDLLTQRLAEGANAVLGGVVHTTG